ncbi:MAG: hypothetical protein Q8Q39_03145 [bacterium]|nr:hypothetical protein [bacterium]
MRYDNVWIYMAGHSKRIKANEPNHWRCFVGDDPNEIPISAWSIEGEITAKNFIPETDPGGNKFGLTAWIRVFGDLVLEKDGSARITLKDPR